MHSKNTNDITPIEAEHGEIIRELVGHAAGGGSQHSLAHITLPAGKASLKHYHPVAEESYYILSGKGRMIINDKEHRLNAGDAVAIPANAVHQLFNDSGEPLIFLAVCAPPWTPDCSVFVD